MAERAQIKMQAGCREGGRRAWVQKTRHAPHIHGVGILPVLQSIVGFPKEKYTRNKEGCILYVGLHPKVSATGLGGTFGGGGGGGTILSLAREAGR